MTHYHVITTVDGQALKDQRFDAADVAFTIALYNSAVLDACGMHGSARVVICAKEHTR